ncbi:MAG: tyrosine-type recombinase/integrase [Candidatus Bathyarchaeia archaeon]
MKNCGKCGNSEGVTENMAEAHYTQGSPKNEEVTQPIACPSCGSTKAWKDGLRKTDTGNIQRWLCRECGFRFSSVSELKNKKENQHKFMRRVCVADGAMINLATVESQKSGLAGATATADAKGKIVEFLWHLQKNGVKGITLKSYSSILKKLANKTDLTPENVKEYLAKNSEWSDSTKSLCVIIYGSFLKYIGLSWQPPRYRAAEKLPLIPTEADIDQLISGSGRKLSTFLLFLKETGVRCGEASRLKWSDIDFERRIVRITPEKGSRSRILPVSNRLINMLNNLPRSSEKVWATLYSLKSNFYKTRKSLAFKLQNPKLKQIGLHTFRHWKATMEYHRTKDILHVQQLLGHRDLRNTLIYINLEKALFQNVDDEFHVKVAHSLDEACKLLEVGFEYVTDIAGAAIFRKRK